MKDELKILCFSILLVAIPMSAIILPVAWFDGHAKSSWLKKTQGIDIPWYEATFLDFEINSSDITIKGDINDGR